jgi:hypothetical protein
MQEALKFTVQLFCGAVCRKNQGWQALCSGLEVICGLL